MTIIQTPPARIDDESIETGLPHDFYRLIHKGIRCAMFHATMQAGSVDVGDAEQVDDLLARCTDLIGILHVHHHQSVHMALRQSMPLDVLVDGLELMLPAMNITERADMLAGMSSAPADVFAVVRRAAESALTPAQFAEVADRIGLD